ncbi:MAG: class II glutamine amidotransferase [Chloroflexi bacterium]|nr:class II glutamine amidotransferase [Chloroflexota bacterium]
MCELLGLAFSEPVTARVSFRGFRHRGSYNPDGWGLAWFTSDQANICKEAKPANESEEAAALAEERQLTSRIFIGHVRRASIGGVCYDNTHPFQQALRGASVVLAHNGTLQGLRPPRRFRPKGKTDSEQALCLMLDWMDEKDVSFSDFAEIETWLRDLNDRGKMNLLFSNGSELFAYRDSNGYNGLCFTYRKAPFSSIRLEDEDCGVELAEEKRPSEKGFVIATRPLTNERWCDLTKGRLLVIRDGEAVFGDPRS